MRLTVNGHSSIDLILVRGKDKVSLMATDSEDEAWYLLEFYTDGSIRKNCDIPKELGLRLNSNGCLETIEEQSY